MTQKRLADLRPVIATHEDATAVLSKIARVECKVAIQKARCEKKIADAKARYEAAVAEDLAEQKTLCLLLADFIMNNRDLFKKPRKISTDWGTYGLQTVTELIVHNREAMTNRLLEAGYESCLKTVHTPVKKAIQARIEAGQPITGCTLHKGDTAVYKVSKAVIDEAREKALR